MAGLTLDICEAKLTAYLAAETAVLAGQDTIVDGTRLTRADLTAIQDGIKLWDARCKQYGNSGRLKTMQVIPL